MVASVSSCYSIVLVLLVLSQQRPLAYGYQVPVGDRRQFLASAGTMWIGVRAAAIGTMVGQPSEAQAVSVLKSKGCYQGEGEACAELAEDNALIKSLQEKSAMNRLRNEREARDAYWMKNYSDYFASVGKIMIKKPDGSFLLVSDAEFEQLKLANKLTIETPKAMGGKFTDLTQKPILVLKE